MARVTRRGFIGGVGAVGAASLIGPRRAAAAGGRVVVGTWGGDYQNLQTQHIVPLLAKDSVEVVFDTANDTARKVKLMAEQRLPRGTVDIQALSAAGSYEMWKAGTLLELDPKKLQNWDKIIPKLQSKYSVPHIWSGRVILYNPAKVDPAPTSYADLWDPKWASRVGIIDIQYQTTIESAALVNGGSLTNYEPGKAKLLELKKMGAKIYPTNEAMAQALKTEEVWMCIMWKARGVMWQNAGVPIKPATPKEGVVLYVSEYTIAKNAPNKDAAYAYLDATLDPRAQVGFIDSMGYNPTVIDAEMAPATGARIGFTTEEQKNLLLQDYGYIAENDAQLQEWWNKVFKA